MAMSSRAVKTALLAALLLGTVGAGCGNGLTGLDEAGAPDGATVGDHRDVASTGDWSDADLADSGTGSCPVGDGAAHVAGTHAGGAPSGTDERLVGTACAGFP